MRVQSHERVSRTPLNCPGPGRFKVHLRAQLAEQARKVHLGVSHRVSILEILERTSKETRWLSPFTNSRTVTAQPGPRTFARVLQPVISVITVLLHQLQGSNPDRRIGRDPCARVAPNV